MNALEREQQRAQRERALFDALPMPAFVVDADARIHNFNTAAEAFLGPEPALALSRRGGEAWHCIHSEVNGCGRAEVCRDCVIRDSIHKAMDLQATWRERHKAELRDGRKVRQLDLLVTTSLVPYSEPPQALVLLEDVTELVRLRELVPICSRCRQVRDDRGYWKHLERYLKQRLGAIFAESLCPDCAAGKRVTPARKLSKRARI